MAQAVELDARERLSRASAEMRDSLDFPAEYVVPAYRHGVALYDHGRYEEAEQVFLFLAACEVGNAAIWKALGSARKMAGRHADAVAAFGVAVNAGASDPWIPLHAAECLMHLQKYPEALAALQHAALAAPGDARELRRRIGALLEGVERSLAAI